MPLARLTTTLAVALLLGACARGTPEAPLADDLQRDLDMARGTAVELAPQSGVRQVVSAIESPPPASRSRPVQTAPRRAPAPTPPRPAPVPVAAATDPEPQVSAPTRAPTAQTGEYVIVEDAPIEAPREAPPGGWKSTRDVIRNAPFPIKPLVGDR